MRAAEEKVEDSVGGEDRIIALNVEKTFAVSYTDTVVSITLVTKLRRLASLFSKHVTQLEETDLILGTFLFCRPWYGTIAWSYLVIPCAKNIC